MPHVLDAAGGPLSLASVLPQEVGRVDGGVDLKALITNSDELLLITEFHIVRFTESYVLGSKGGVVSRIPTEIVQECCYGMSLNIDLGRKSGIVVDGGSTKEPCPVHMANEEGLEVGLHELACPAHKFRIDDLDSGNGGVGHCRVTRKRPRVMRYSGDGGREG